MKLPVLLVAALVAACSCPSSDKPAPTVDFAGACADLAKRGDASLALKWYRTASERDALYLQAFGVAESRLEALAKPAGPWAVVMDADETVLDNSPFTCAGELQKSKKYDPAIWQAWVARKSAAATPGAASFIRKVHEQGGRVIVITNRDDEKDRTKSPTRDNLQALGIKVDAILFKLDASDDDKNRRFHAVQLTGVPDENIPPLEVVMYLGDNIRDFPDLAQGRLGDIREFGSRYFVLPNPMYGSFTANAFH